MDMNSRAVFALISSLAAMEDMKHSGSKGVVCGRDFGKSRQKQPRNTPCVCGSGKKAKKCCVYYPREKETA